MPATVHPDSFENVFFEVDQIVDAVDAAVAAVPVVTADGIEVNVDEELPTSRVKIRSLEPVVLDIESGALEKKNNPRNFGPEEAKAVLAKLLLEVEDRRDVAFGAPGLGEPSDFALRIAWDVTLYGRVGRLGFRVHQPRYRYDFRNRLGFSDAADAVFDQLWAERPATWTDLEALLTDH